MHQLNNQYVVPRFDLTLMDGLTPRCRQLEVRSCLTDRKFVQIDDKQRAGRAFIGQYVLCLLASGSGDQVPTFEDVLVMERELLHVIVGPDIDYDFRVRPSRRLHTRCAAD